MTPYQGASVLIITCGVALGGIVVTTGCTAAPPAAPAAEQAPAPAPAAATPAPVTSVNDMMVSWVDNASHVLWDVEKPGFAPKNDADWIEIEDHATQLMAASTLLQVGGNGPMDAVWIRSEQWKTHADAMGAAGRAVLTAAKARDLKGVIEANGGLTSSCENCHDVFKPDAQSEGILHQTPHSETHPHN